MLPKIKVIFLRLPKLHRHTDWAHHAKSAPPPAIQEMPLRSKSCFFNLLLGVARVSLYFRVSSGVNLGGRGEGVSSTIFKTIRFLEKSFHLVCNLFRNPWMLSRNPFLSSTNPLFVLKTSIDVLLISGDLLKKPILRSNYVCEKRLCFPKEFFWFP